MTTAALDAIWFTRCPVPTATGIAADQGWLARSSPTTGSRSARCRTTTPACPARPITPTL
ncbi:hypothetical protein ACFQ0B_54580 [Nonomuraea thailandensis]